ncbi:hypothetical protein PG997_004933 [Apiospora hydei]|uniref:Uncharacterized protein n=1 Tax=Apiospora hydei TaxID=1337664 RepID=A0ABR1X3P2_9PEZI
MAQTGTSDIPSPEGSKHHSATLPEVCPESGLLVIPPDSTLEVYRPQIQHASGLEVTSSCYEPATPPEKKLPWSRTHRIWIIAGAIVVAGGIIAGVVGGTVGSKSRYEGSTEALSSSLSLPVQTPSTTSVSSATSTPITSTSSSTSSARTTKTETVSTRIAAPSATPSNQVYVGELDDGTSIDFVANASANAACAWAVNPVREGHNPCDSVFRLPHGIDYIWNDCGGEVWITWRNPSNDNEINYQDLGNPKGCGDVPKTYKCGTETIHAKYICPDHPIGG